MPRKIFVTESDTVLVNNGGNNLRAAELNVKFAFEFIGTPEVKVSIRSVQVDRDGEHPVRAVITAVRADSKTLYAKLDASQAPAGLVNSAEFEYSASGFVKA